MSLSKKFTSVFAMVLTIVLLAMVLFITRPATVEADGITNYAARLKVDTGTAQTADFSSTAYNVESYGSVYVQVTQDITDATDSATYTMYYSLDTGACSAVTNWSIGYDRVLVQNPAVAASRYVSYTTQPTTTGAVTITYNYADVAAVAASLTAVEQAQSFTITGDGTKAIEFDTHGALCWKVVGDITTGRTVTTTINAQPVDIYY